MLNNDEININLLANTIEQDAVIAAKVLRMANSSFYGVTRAVTNIDDAVSILGVAKLHSLVVASGVTGVVTHVPGLDLKKFWGHSLLAAGISRETARHLSLDVEVAYIAGLLHNIGDLLLHLVFPVMASEVDVMCVGASAEQRRLIERDVIGFDHCQIGEELALRWSFPSEISRVLVSYTVPLGKGACGLAPVIYAAAHIAQGLVRGDEAHVIVASFDAEVAEHLKLTEDALLAAIERYRSLLQEVNAMM